MQKAKLFILLFFILAARTASAQEVLPGITVRDFNGKIVVSWQNAYNVPISNISIQRSFDSTKNYTTIGSVLNPQNLENGYADDKPPYNKMYYRAFISFEGGAYLFSSVVRPVKDSGAGDSSNIAQATRFPWQVDPFADSSMQLPPGKDSLKKNANLVTYPSRLIYSERENNVVIHLADAAVKKYHAKFYDESNNFLFELTKLREEFLIVEKVNFVHAGWFHFELFENGKLVEKNKFYIGKDIKSNGDSLKRSGNK